MRQVLLLASAVVAALVMLLLLADAAKAGPIEDDRALLAADVRKTTVYFSTCGAEEPEKLEQAFRFVSNSLSWEPIFYWPRHVTECIFAFDTSIWRGDFLRYNVIQSIVPPAIYQDEQVNEVDYADVNDLDATDPRLGQKRVLTLDMLSRPTGAVPAAWFIQAATRPPLYHDMLGLPENVAGLERRLGIDRNANIADDIVRRAFTMHSGPSLSQRLVERHPSPYGAYWVSYETATDVDDPQNDFWTKPFGPAALGGFQHDAGEVIWNLPNGLQAYLVIDANGFRVDVGARSFVRDFRGIHRDPSVVNGLSCMGCHDLGMNFVSDELLPVYEDLAVAGMVGAEPIERLRRVLDGNEMFDLLSEDQDRFLAALDELEIPTDGLNVAEAAVLDFFEDVRLEDALRDAGISERRFETLAESDFELAVALARLRWGGMPRARWAYVLARLI